MNPYVQYMYSYPHKTAYRPLTGISLKDYTPFLSGTKNSLYIHIPFCQTKCGYCNLFSVTGQGGEDMDRYLDAAERQSRQYAEVLKGIPGEFAELVIGGGTPLLLEERQMERMFGLAEKYFLFRDDKELVIETAPNQTTGEKLKILKSAGATRVSMGIQSFSDRELSVLGRHHGAGKAREALDLLKTFDFPCVNVDFIYGIPGQTTESLLDSLKEALRFEPDEIFLYPLYVKHGAGLEREGVVPDPQAAFGQYQNAAGFLRGEGFRQDSMRRFVKKSGERKFSECGFGTSLSLGCGGRSYLGNLHFCSPYAITGRECLERLKDYENTKDHTAITHGILLSHEELKRRYVIRHLLIRPGLDPGRYEEHFGSSALEDFPLLQEWMDEGFAEMHVRNADGSSFLVLTDEGLGFSDYLGPQLISRQIKGAMSEWEVMHGTHGQNDSISGKFKKL